MEAYILFKGRSVEFFTPSCILVVPNLFRNTLTTLSAELKHPLLMLFNTSNHIKTNIAAFSSKTLILLGPFYQLYW